MPLTVNGISNLSFVYANGTEVRTVVANGTTVYVKIWITFNENGGSTVSDRYVWYGRTYGQYAALPTPTRSGYTFQGWYTGNNGTGALIANSTVVTWTNITQTLYAYWTSNVVQTTAPSFNGWTYFNQWYIAIRNNDSLSADIRANDYSPPSTFRGTAASGSTVQSYSSQPSFATFTHYATAVASNGSKTTSNIVSQTIT